MLRPELQLGNIEEPDFAKGLIRKNGSGTKNCTGPSGMPNLPGSLALRRALHNYTIKLGGGMRRQMVTHEACQNKIEILILIYWISKKAKILKYNLICIKSNLIYSG